jgi:hypothetical protein
MYSAKRRPFNGNKLITKHLLAIYPLWDDAEDNIVKQVLPGQYGDGVASVDTELLFAVGKVGAAYRFTGTQYITLPAELATRLSNGRAFSIALIVKPVTFVTDRILIGNTDTERGIYVKINSDQTVEFGLMDTAKSRIITSVSTLTADQWSFVVATYDGSATDAGLKLYVNSVSEGATTAAGTWPTTATTDLFLGGRTSGVDHFYANAAMEHVVFYKQAINQDTVDEFYNDGDGVRYNEAKENYFNNHPTLWVGLRNSWPCNGNEYVSVTSEGTVTTIANKNLTLYTAAGATHLDNFNGHICQVALASFEWNPSLRNAISYYVP